MVDSSLQICNLLGRLLATSATPQTTKMARYVVALAHEGMLAKMESGAVPSFEELMKAPKSHEAVNAELIKLARALLRQEYEEWVGTVANPRLNLQTPPPTKQ